MVCVSSATPLISSCHPDDVLGVVGRGGGDGVVCRAHLERGGALVTRPRPFGRGLGRVGESVSCSRPLGRGHWRGGELVIHPRPWTCPTCDTRASAVSIVLGLGGIVRDVCPQGTVTPALSCFGRHGADVICVSSATPSCHPDDVVGVVGRGRGDGVVCRARLERGGALVTRPRPFGQGLGRVGESVSCQRPLGRGH